VTQDDRAHRLVLRDSLDVRVDGERTHLDGSSDADLLLVNDEDLTFAIARTDPASLDLLLSRGGELPTAVGRTLALTTAWSLLYDHELTAERFVDCGVGVLSRETADSVVEPLLGRLVEAADHWAHPSVRDGLMARVADLCITLADPPGNRVAALRGLAQSATTAGQLEALAIQATDPDLRWRRLIRLAELGQLDEAELVQLLGEDQNPDAWMNAVRARSAVPSAEAKAEAWQVVVVDRKIPPGVLGKVGRAFWRPGQDELLTPYAEKFLQSLNEFSETGMLWAMSLSGGFYPAVGGDDRFRDRLGAAASGDGVSPLVRQTVRALNDRRRRREAARAEA